MSFPFILSDSVTLAASASVVADAEALSHRFHEDVYLDEIRWSLRSQDVNRIPYHGMLVSTQLALGRHVITDGFVPIWSFGTVMQSDFFVGGVGGPGGIVEAQKDYWLGAVFVNRGVVYSQHRWKLPEPLFIPAGNSVTSAFSRGADSVSGNFIVNVAYSCRTTKKRPRLVAVPWVTAFKCTGAAQYRSAEDNLHNPFNVPLRVQRLVFRAGNSSYKNIALDTSTTALSLKDRAGEDIVKTAIAPDFICQYQRRAWTFNQVLQPADFIRASITGATASDTLHLSLIGTRDERVS